MRAETDATSAVAVPKPTCPAAERSLLSGLVDLLAVQLGVYLRPRTVWIANAGTPQLGSFSLNGAHGTHERIGDLDPGDVAMSRDQVGRNVVDPSWLE